MHSLVDVFACSVPSPQSDRSETEEDKLIEEWNVLR